MLDEKSDSHDIYSKVWQQSISTVWNAKELATLRRKMFVQFVYRPDPLLISNNCAYDSSCQTTTGKSKLTNICRSIYSDDDCKANSHIDLWLRRKIDGLSRAEVFICQELVQLGLHRFK